MRIDLHTHSWVSDGTEAPGDVVRQASVVGLDVMALTDHDAVEGWEEARSVALKEGVGWVAGIELTCRVPETGVSVHMLAYLVDPEDPTLVREMEELRETRLHRAQMMAERLAEDFPITWADVVAQTQDGATIGRPHLADALVAAGVVPNRSAAFRDLLAGRSRYYVGQPAMDPAYAVDLVNQAGGVAVMAHPAAPTRGRVIRQRDMDACLEAGLAGLEIFHRDNDEEGRTWLRSVAQEHDLIVTGASDYHGAGKPNQLGENLTEPQQLRRILAKARPGHRASLTQGLPVEW